MKNRLLLWIKSHRAACKKVLIGSGIGIICLVLVGFALLHFDKNEIDWDMQGYLVSADGTIEDSVSMRVTGDMDKEGSHTYFDIDILPENDFIYRFDTPEPDGYISTSQEGDPLPFCTFSSFSFHNANGATQTFFAIDTEKEYMIIHWNDGTGRYLVAATDSDVTAQEILEYFRKFVDHYSSKP